MTERTQWEYTRIQVLDTGKQKTPLITVNGSQVSSPSLTALLNGAGADGWEMVGIGVVGYERSDAILTEYVFKRPV